MIKLNVKQNDMERLLKYHSEYMERSLKRNWKKMYAKADQREAIIKIAGRVNDKIKERTECQTSNTPTVSGQENADKLFLDNMLDCCTTRHLDTYAICTEELFPDAVTRNSYKDILLKMTGYDRFSKVSEQKGSGQEKIWNRQTLLQSLHTNVCPYCNRQYITSFQRNGNSVATADIDHYYPRSQYPLLSMNFFNLIPSCCVCNTRLKGSKKIDPKGRTLHPYFDESDSLRFRTAEDVTGYLYHDKDPELFLEVNKEKDKDVQERAENSKEVFYLEKVYQAHVSEVKKIRDNVYRFSSKKFDSVFQKNYNEIFRDYEEFREALFYFNNLDESEEPLVKLKKDIYRQLYEET